MHTTLTNVTIQKHSDVVGICGEYWSKDGRDKNYVRDIRRMTLFDKGLRERVISLDDFTTFSIAIGAYKRSVFKHTLFPTGFTNSYGEDTYFQIHLHNLGYQLMYSPNIIGIHDAFISKQHLFRKMIFEMRATGNILLKASHQRDNKLTIPYLHYFLSYPLGLVVFSILSFAVSQIFILPTIFFMLLEIVPLSRIFRLQNYPLYKRANAALYVLVKELTQAIYLPLYLLLRTPNPKQFLFFVQTLTRWELKKSRGKEPTSLRSGF